MQLQTSMSALQTFQRCQKRYEYKYVRGWTPRKVTPEMEMGTVIHAGLGELYTYWQMPIQMKLEHAHAGIDVAASARSFDQTQVDLCHDVLDYYWEHQGKDDTFDEILSVEVPGELRLGEYGIRCTLDVLCRQNGTLTIIDHKTVGTVKEALAFLPLDFQFKLYPLMVYRTYGEVPEVLYNAIRREVPPGYGHRSPFTRSGAKSKASLDPGEYLRRERVPHTVDQLEAFERELHALLKTVETADVFGHLRNPIRVGGQACSGCPYYRPCIAELEGKTLDEAAVGMLYNIATDPLAKV